MFLRIIDPKITGCLHEKRNETTKSKLRLPASSFKAEKSCDIETELQNSDYRCDEQHPDRESPSHDSSTTAAEPPSRPPNHRHVGSSCCGRRVAHAKIRGYVNRILSGLLVIPLLISAVQYIHLMGHGGSFLICPEFQFSPDTLPFLNCQSHLPANINTWIT